MAKVASICDPRLCSPTLIKFWWHVNHGHVSVCAKDLTLAPWDLWGFQEGFCLEFWPAAHIHAQANLSSFFVCICLLLFCTGRTCSRPVSCLPHASVCMHRIGPCIHAQAQDFLSSFLPSSQIILSWSRPGSKYRTVTQEVLWPQRHGWSFWWQTAGLALELAVAAADNHTCASSYHANCGMAHKCSSWIKVSDRCSKVGREKEQGPPVSPLQPSRRIRPSLKISVSCLFRIQNGYRRVPWFWACVRAACVPVLSMTFMFFGAHGWWAGTVNEAITKVCQQVTMRFTPRKCMKDADP